MSDIKSKWDELLRKARERKPRRPRHEEEHQIQCACVNWFRLQYPQFHHNLFAVPNGGKRDEVTAAKMKAEGQLAGVADLILLRPSGEFHGLCIEMKTRKGRQADTQRAWQQLIEKDGYKYVICRSLEDFMQEINNYLSN